MLRRALHTPILRFGSLCVLVAIGWGLVDFDLFDVPELKPSAKFSTSLPEAATVEDGYRRCLAERPPLDPVRLLALWWTAPPAPLTPTRPRSSRDVVHTVAQPRQAASKEVTPPGTAADPPRRHV